MCVDMLDVQLELLGPHWNPFLQCACFEQGGRERQHRLRVRVSKLCPQMHASVPVAVCVTTSFNYDVLCTLSIALTPHTHIHTHTLLLAALPRPLEHHQGWRSTLGRPNRGVVAFSRLTLSL